jgi:hypothetical protein
VARGVSGGTDGGRHKRRAGGRICFSKKADEEMCYMEQRGRLNRMRSTNESKSIKVFVDPQQQHAVLQRRFWGLCPTANPIGRRPPPADGGA